MKHLVISLAKRYLRSHLPLRGLLSRACKKYQVLTLEEQFELNLLERPHYFFCMLRGAKLAASLGYERASVLELGVAGGNGLVYLESIKSEVERLSGVTIEIYGFDTTEGLPEPRSYKDLPYKWKQGFYNMDVDALLTKLECSKLVIGDVAETSKTFFDEYDPAPICAVMHDMDFYSSTKDALRLFDCDDSRILPRF